MESKKSEITTPGSGSPHGASVNIQSKVSFQLIIKTNLQVPQKSCRLCYNPITTHRVKFNQMK